MFEIKFDCNQRPPRWTWKCFVSHQREQKHLPPPPVFIGVCVPSGLGLQIHGITVILQCFEFFDQKPTFMKRPWKVISSAHHLLFWLMWHSTEVIISMCNRAFFESDSSLPSVCGVEKCCSKADGKDWIFYSLSEMGGSFFKGFNILFLAVRRKRHADMSSSTTSPPWWRGTHSAASPFVVSALGMWHWSLIFQLKPWGR